MASSSEQQQESRATTPSSSSEQHPAKRKLGCACNRVTAKPKPFGVRVYTTSEDGELRGRLIKSVMLDVAPLIKHMLAKIREERERLQAELDRETAAKLEAQGKDPDSAERSFVMGKPFVYPNGELLFYYHVFEGPLFGMEESGWEDSDFEGEEPRIKDRHRRFAWPIAKDALGMLRQFASECRVLKRAELYPVNPLEDELQDYPIVMMDSWC